MHGAKTHWGPLARVSDAVTCSTSRTKAGSRVAPKPMLWGNTVAPYMLPSPCTESMPYSSGMCKRVANSACWKRSTMSAQAVGVFWLGVDPPPDRMLPRFQVVMGVASAYTWPRSVCVIWPTFSASVIRASRSATRLVTGRLASLYGSPCLGATVSPPLVPAEAAAPGTVKAVANVAAAINVAAAMRAVSAAARDRPYQGRLVGGAVMLFTSGALRLSRRRVDR